MVAVAVLRYRPLLSMPGGITIVIEAVAALVAFGALIIWIPRLATQAVFSAGVSLGALAAVVQVMHLVVERFVHIAPSVEGFVSLTFMLTTFLLWGVAGFRAASESGAMKFGATVGLWSAIVTMTLVVAAGFLSEFFLAPPNSAEVAEWAEYLRSAWNDPRAFALANTMESGMSHLILGPVVGAVCGVAGGAVSRLRSWRF